MQQACGQWTTTRTEERFWGGTRRAGEQIAAVEGYAPGEVTCKVCGLQFQMDEETLRSQVCKCLYGLLEPQPLPLIPEDSRPKVADKDDLKIETDYRIHNLLTWTEQQSLLNSRGGRGQPGRRYISIDNRWISDVFESERVLDSGWCDEEWREELLTWDRIRVGNFESCEGYAGGSVYLFIPTGVVVGSVSLYW